MSISELKPSELNEANKHMLKELQREEERLILLSFCIIMNNKIRLGNSAS